MELTPLQSLLAGELEVPPIRAIEHTKNGDPLQSLLAGELEGVESASIAF